MKEKHNIIFIFLCYKNTTDIRNLLRCLKSSRLDYAAVIINSFYDLESEESIRNISTEYHCAYASVENKGYGHGNNYGIDLALKEYEFDYLCICNPDILFSNTEMIKLPQDTKCIIAPSIQTTTGKLQNPYYAYRSIIVDQIKHIACKNESKLLFYSAVAMNKINNMIYRLWVHRSKRRIFACHGACFFIGINALVEMVPLFNEDMFLFNEEEHVARKARQYRIPILYEMSIKVYHFEDGSSDDIVREKKVFKLICQSYNVLERIWRK